MEIQIGEKLFEFTGFYNWCDTAKHKFQRAGVNGRDVLCIDSNGRICGWGTHFRLAQEQSAFPVSAYLMRPPETPNVTLCGERSESERAQG